MATPLAGVSIDTRTLCAGDVYLALRGDRHDGHDYLRQAVSNGAAMVVVSDIEKADGLGDVPGGVLAVDDVLGALQGLGRAYREQLHQQGTRVIAVTGSNGKTTTRNLIHAVLSAKHTGSQSPKNFNNHIGVPLSILAAGGEDKFVVIELGSNHPGEIAALAGLVEPDVAVITHIGSSHLGQLGSRESIAAEKASLLKYVRPGGLVVVPGDEPLLEGYLGDMADGVELIRFGCSPGSDVRLENYVSGKAGLKFCAELDGVDGSVDRKRFEVSLMGRHNAMNALAAVSVGMRLGLDDVLIQSGLSNVKSISMRLETTCWDTSRGPLTVINDAYNASPESMAAAVDVLLEYPLAVLSVSQSGGNGDVEEGRVDEPSGLGRRVLILGDMLELGDQGPKLHYELGQAIASKRQGIDWVVLIGRLSTHVAEGIRETLPRMSVDVCPSWDDTLSDMFAGQLRPGDVVLIKASRGMMFERMMPRIEKIVSGWESQEIIVLPAGVSVEMNGGSYPNHKK